MTVECKCVLISAVGDQSIRGNRNVTGALHNVRQTLRSFMQTAFIVGGFAANEFVSQEIKDRLRGQITEISVPTGTIREA